MGQGLGKNTPVVLTLGKANYEALINRHGQWIRWRTAVKCSCVNYPSMQPDIHCKICSGRGVIYSFQKTQTVFTTSMAKDNSGILEIEEDYRDCELVKVYDSTGHEFVNAEKLGVYVHLNAETTNIKGVYYNVVMTQTNTKCIESAQAEKQKDGYYIVPGLKSIKTSIEGIYYNSPADILSIESIIDAAGIEYKAKEFRLDTFYIEPTKDEDGEIIPITEPLTVTNVEYIPPFIFALLNQNLSKADLQAVTDSQGDAVVTFPYSCDVAIDDVLTVFAGTITQKDVIAKSKIQEDTLGAFFVSDIVSLNSVENNEVTEYVQGIDYILSGTNKIKWIGDNIPEVGKAFSVTYHVNPTYKVVKDIPQLRTSENQRFPKKAVVKFYNSYSDKIGINRQDGAVKGIKGSL